MDKHDPSAPPMPIAVPVAYPENASIVAAPYDDDSSSPREASTSELLQQSLGQIYRYSKMKVDNLCTWFLDKTKQDPNNATLDQALKALQSRALHLHRCINELKDKERDCQRALLVARQHTMDANAILEMGKRRVTEYQEVLKDKLETFQKTISEETIDADMDADQLICLYIRTKQSIDKLLAPPPATTVQDHTALQDSIDNLVNLEGKVTECKKAEQPILDRQTEIHNQLEKRKGELDRVEELMANLECPKH